MTRLADPFRTEDLAARVAALRSERDAATAELARIRAELKSHRPWSYWRFALGTITPIVGLVLAWLLLAYAH